MTDAARPRVTVVVPCKERADYLPATLESILSQDYPHIECIVVDSASTDGTVELLRAYESRGVQWVSEPDSGAFDAITKGWARGTGTIITWLNADDTWEPGAVSAAVEYLEAHPRADVVYGHCGLMDDDGRVSRLLRAREFKLEVSVLYCDHVIMQSASFLRRTAVEAAGGLFPAWTHDQELWLSIAMNGGTFATLDRHLANVRDIDGHMHTRPDVMVPARVAMMERFFASPALPANLRSLERRALSNTYLRGFDVLRPRKASHWKWGWYCLTNAVRECPSNTPFVLAGIAERAINRFEPVRRTAHGVGRVAKPVAKRPWLLATMAGAAALLDARRRAARHT